jgi:hypothetical protein
VVTALLVTSAATLLESAPFILAAMALAHAPLRWSSRMVPYLGCGCGTGPSARSLPAAAAAWLAFGPLVACARLAAAILAERIFTRSRSCPHHDDSLLTQLFKIVPLAITGAALALFIPAVFGMHPAPVAAFAGASLAAFVAAPCAIGTVALAASLRSALPAAAAGILCVAGIVDLRTWIRSSHPKPQHDALAYAVTAIVSAIIAARSGAGLVHPKIALALWPCAAACAVLAYRHRWEQSAQMRIAPLVMLAGTILSAPPPEYHATETSLADAFAGERIDFTGVATHTGNATTLVRYAITCCRADAAPIVIRLAANAASLHGWIHARGELVQATTGLVLHADSLRAIAPPADPFVYR